MSKRSVIRHLFQKRSLILWPAIPSKNFSSLQSLCMKFSDLTFSVQKSTFVMKKCLKVSFVQRFRPVLHMWDMTHSYVWRDSFICVTYSCAWHDSFMRVTWAIHMCDMTPSDVWRDPFTCVTWINHMFDIIHFYVTWLIHMCDVTNSHKTMATA